MKLKICLAFLLFLTFGFVFFTSNLHGERSVQDPCDMKQIPPRLREILQKKFSSWRILTLKDLSEEDQRFWTRSEKRSGCPGMASGHYEVTTALSYVLSLVPRAGNSTGYRLVIFRPEEEGLYKEVILEKYDGPANPLVVYTVPPGRYWNDERNSSVQLSMEGFQSEQKESGAFLYFWEGGSLRQWTISE